MEDQTKRLDTLIRTDLFMEDWNTLNMTQRKIKVNLGFTEPYKWELRVLHRKKKIKKLRISDAGEINLKKN